MRAISATVPAAVPAAVVAAVLAAAAGGCSAQAVQQQRDGRRLTIEQLIDIKHPSTPMWAPDGQSVVFVWDRAGVSQVFVAAATGSGAPRELKEAGSSLNGAFWSADGRALMLPRNGDLWRVPIDGGAASAVWTTPQAELAITPSPDGARVAFVRPLTDPGSSAAAAPATTRGSRATMSPAAQATAGGSDLVVRTLADGRETRLLHADNRSLGSISWSPDGQSLVVSDAPRTIRHEQTPTYSGAKIIYTINENVPGETMVVPASGGAPKPIAGAGGFGGRRWLDARHFILDRTSADYKRRTTFLVDIAGGEPAVLHEDVEDKFWSMTGDAGANAQPSPDGKWIAFLSDRDGWDHLYVMAASAEASAREPVQITKGKFEAWRPTWSPDSQRIAFDANEPDRNGTRHLYVAAINGNPAAATITALTSGRGTNIAPVWSPDGKRIVYQHTDPQNSADLYVIDPATRQTVRLSDSMPPSIDRAALVSPEMVHYAGPDGQQVPAWLYVPKNLDRSKKHPAIVWIHGDGVNQNYDGWHVQRNYAVYSSFHQYLLQKGYVVIAPDYRGSIGYGRAWREGVYMDVGGKDAKDAWMVTDYLKTLPYVDMNRVGVWGLSYGGFFTLIAVTDQPKLFRAAVDVAGVVDYAMYYEDPYHGGWTASRIGTPDQHPDVYAHASPISNIARLETPLLVLHGTADVNVPYLHSVRLIDELMKKDKSHLVSFMTYPGEFHYFTREHVLRDAWHRVDDFFEANLRGGPTTSH
ncbi:MAG TPA: prolyl oligopeptidase family serine peptidase [Vicinamibacterales bacterium]|nr:prolyl oligopeptidase family serine peptidase [Vicinamibacterales bacterium]